MVRFALHLWFFLQLLDWHMRDKISTVGRQRSRYFLWKIDLDTQGIILQIIETIYISSADLPKQSHPLVDIPEPSPPLTKLSIAITLSVEISSVENFVGKKYSSAINFATCQKFCHFLPTFTFNRRNFLSIRYCNDVRFLDEKINGGSTVKRQKLGKLSHFFRFCRVFLS